MAVTIAQWTNTLVLCLTLQDHPNICPKYEFPRTNKECSMRIDTFNNMLTRGVSPINGLTGAQEWALMLPGVQNGLINAKLQLQVNRQKTIKSLRDFCSRAERALQ